MILVPLAIAAVLVALVATLILSPHTLLGVGEKTLASSLQGKIGFSGGDSRCRERKRGFACSVDDPSGGGPRYLVAVDGGCWKARRPGQAHREAKLGGCVGIGDYVRLPELNSG